MHLPNAEQAVIDIRKLRDYCLSTTHPVGKHKAVVFAATLGWTAGDAEQMREKILAALPTQEATPMRADEFGQRYQVDLPLTTEAGAATVRTAWII